MSLILPLTIDATASFPATGTSASLSGDVQHWAWVLLIEGYNLGFTTSDEVAALDTAWTAVSEWTAIYGGLGMIGDVSYSAFPFDSSVDMPGMTFEITDAGNVLLPVAMRESSTTAIKERLADLTTASMDSNDATLLMGDSSAFPSSGTVYVGTEEITYTSNGGGGLLGGLTRGVRSLFGTAYGNNFGRPHEISFSSDHTGVRPMVSTEPRGLLGKTVGLYLCVKRDGVWTAGLPGSSSNDAECVWAGTIRSIGDDGTGRVTLECASIMELLKGSLLTKQYKGYLAEGAALSQQFGHGHFRVKTQVTDSSGSMQSSTYPAAVNLLTSGGDGTYTANDIAELINAQLSTWFVTGGTFPANQSLGIGLTSSNEDSNRYAWHAEETTAGTRLFDVEIELHERVWLLLGWPNGVGLIKHAGVYATLKMSGGASVSATAPNAPIRSTLTGNGEHIFSVVPMNGVSFVTQPNIPAALAGNPDQPTTAFFKIGGKHITGVRSTGTNTFAITQPLNEFFTELGLPSVGNAIEEALDYTGTLEGMTGDGVVVEQVWIEIDRCVEVFRRLMLSTGTTGYNDLNYDVNPRQMGLGVPDKLVDVEHGLTLLGAKPYVLYLDRPTPFLRLLESAMQLRNLHVTWRRSKITLVGFGEDATGGVALTEANKAVQLSPNGAQVVERSVVRRTFDHIVNRVVFKYSVPFGGGDGKTVTINDVDSQTEFGVQPVTVEALGIFEHVAGAGAVDEFVSALAAGALPYFARPLAIIERSYNISLIASLYPGAQVNITDSGIVSPTAGTRGVSGLQGWVLAVSVNYATAVGRVTILFAPEQGVAHIGALPPSARVDAVSIGLYDYGYDATNKKLLCKPHEYSGPVDTVDVGNFAVGDKVHIIELSCADPTSPTEFADTVASVDTSANTITLTTGLGGVSSVNMSSFATGSFDTVKGVTEGATLGGAYTFTANRLYLLCIHTYSSSGIAVDLSGVPSATAVHSSDPSQTFVFEQIGAAVTSTWAAGVRRMTFFRGMPTATIAGAGQVAVSFDTSTQTAGDVCANQWSITEATGVATGSDGGNAIVQYKIAEMTTVGGAADNAFVTFDSAFQSTSNATAAFWAPHDNAPLTPGVGWTELSDAIHGSGTARLETQWRATNDTTPAATGNAGIIHFCCAAELRAASPLRGKQFVVEYDDVSTVVSTQRGNYVYLADTAHTTGYATNDELYYAGERGISPEGGVAGVIDDQQPYRRLANSGDDRGEPLSVHKYHEICDFADQHMSYHGANMLAYWLPVSGSELLENTSTTDYKLLFGPVRLALYGGERHIRIQIYGSSNTASGNSTVRVVTSTALVRGTSTTFLDTSTTPLIYPDGGLNTDYINVPASTGYAYSDYLDLVPAVWQEDTPYCWLTIHGKAVSGGSCRIKGIFVWERFRERFH